MSGEGGALGDHVVDLEGLDPRVAQAACRLFVDRIARRAATVWVDAFTDATDLPRAAQIARRALLDRSPTGMGIELDLDDDGDLRLLHDVAFWSIHVEVHTGTTIVGSIDDSGQSLSFLGDEADAAAFRALGIAVRQIPLPAARRARWPRSSRRR